jgi:hypothetical protein
MQRMGEKGKLFYLLPWPAAIYIFCGAASDVFSVHAGTRTQYMITLQYAPYDIYMD